MYLPPRRTSPHFELKTNSESRRLINDEFTHDKSKFSLFYKMQLHNLCNQMTSMFKDK